MLNIINGTVRILLILKKQLKFYFLNPNPAVLLERTDPSLEIIYQGPPCFTYLMLHTAQGSYIKLGLS